MTRSSVSGCIGVLLTLAPVLCNAQHATSTPTPTFTVTASNVTMPSSGTVSIPFVLTSVNGFVGQLYMTYTPPTVSANVRLPYMDLGGPVIAFNLTANGTTSGSLTLQAKKSPTTDAPNGTASGSLTLQAKEPTVVPVRLNLPARPGHKEHAIWSLAGVFFLGIGLRRRKAWGTRLSLALCMLIALTGLSACGGGPTLTPGTYTYTLTATQYDPTLPLLPPAPSASTTATVTIPPGIPTD